jgi:hypothetical protein
MIFINPYGINCPHNVYDINRPNHPRGANYNRDVYFNLNYPHNISCPHDADHLHDILVRPVYSCASQHQFIFLASIV